MCKLFTIVEIENQKNAEKFAKAAVPFITETDNHGLGIMRLGEKGIHIQRWLTPPEVLRKKKSKHLAKYEKALSNQMNEEGTRSKELHAIAIHGRFATCVRSLQNTHPFYRDGAALMHNGIITNQFEYKKVVSTCDSEAILTQYLKHEVNKDNDRLTEALRGMQGYQAVIVFNNNGTIDVWRDGTADLFIAHVRYVGVVIATTADIIKEAAKKSKAFITGLDELLPYTVIRWRHGLSPQLGQFEYIRPYVATVKQDVDTPHGTELTHYQNEHERQGLGIEEDKWWEDPAYGAHRGYDQIDDRGFDGKLRGV